MPFNEKAVMIPPTHSLTTIVYTFDKMAFVSQATFDDILLKRNHGILSYFHRSLSTNV